MFRNLGLFVTSLVVLCATALTTTPVQAQNDPIYEFYGRGVHAYFAGEFVEAHGLLTKAIETDNLISDPRFYYFRGLTYLRLGREEEAEKDFKKAGAIESNDPNSMKVVSRSLERIQGTDRYQLEKHRAEARLKVRKRQSKTSEIMEQNRDQSIQRLMGRDVSDRAGNPEPTPFTQNDPDANPQPDQGGAVDDPFDKKEGDVPTAEAAEPDPFGQKGDAPPVPAAGADADPFGDDKGGAPPDPPVPADGAAPVGDEKGVAPPAPPVPAADADPFGDDKGGAPPAPAAGAAPVGDEKGGAPPVPAAGANADPFGDDKGGAPPDPAAGAAPVGDEKGGAPPVPPAPAAGANADPFGDDKGGAPPVPPAPAAGVNADPFGDDKGGAPPAPPAPAAGAAPVGGEKGGAPAAGAAPVGGEKGGGAAKELPKEGAKKPAGKAAADKNKTPPDKDNDQTDPFGDDPAK